MVVEVRSHKDDTKPVKELPIRVVKLEDLTPHEMTIEQELDWFINAVKDSEVIHWGLLVDKHSKLILDGHHRTEGLKRLNYTKAPVHLIDYHDDDLVKLGTWYPLVSVSLETVKQKFNQQGFEIIEDVNFDQTKLENRTYTAFFGSTKNLFAVNTKREEIFKIIRENWLDDIVYYDDAEMCLDNATSDKTAIISWSYNKEEILQHVEEGIIHLPKTTRHVLSFQIPKCNYPLDKLDKRN